MPYICIIPDAATIGTDYVDDGKGNFQGECVSLVKRQCPMLPITAAWKKGDAVKDNTTILPGTAIASFDPKTSKYWHAAIYVRQDASGIWVWDQYKRGKTAHPPKLNRLSWVNPLHPHVAGENFHIIE